jgi:hypothetical protein
MLLRFDIPLNKLDAVGDLTTSALLHFGHKDFSSLSPIKMILLYECPQCRQLYSTDGIIIPDNLNLHFHLYSFSPIIDKLEKYEIRTLCHFDASGSKSRVFAV